LLLLLVRSSARFLMGATRNILTSSRDVSSTLPQSVFLNHAGGKVSSFGEVPERPNGPVSKPYTAISRLPRKTRENPAKQGISALLGILPKRPETSRNAPFR
jgi:hypothetical protein